MNRRQQNQQVARDALAFLFIYHGLVPKLLAHDAVELQLASLMPGGWSPQQIVTVAGVAEIAFGLLIVYCWRSVLPIVLAMLALVGLLIFSLIAMPQLATAAFNPVSTSLLGLVISWLALPT